ncbi:MAG: twin-arginine translocase TatA/TatE family subunit [Candidatus Altiarchaeales archaeon]|nr:MAG: twin-arginine translocase TatA/TatE family subunit [Candidatus Altiarchaeales archaeon]RLI94987.1 MAG: twin-arginine translocase TatA/TatE family subunit [Candidatus Altiarchaeales archaeon]HDO82724.1 twin-arginine translocase TatA/TatE family subunit [Candidatus Altiarchaeales archaeon]HEX55373.1 twin-arginine translocase TatA/TatE family subunit [Candidatus Altiarchaeales archaeon]
MIGTTELIIVFIIAVILFGPERLPELSRNIAKAVSEFRSAMSDIENRKEKRELAG